jgi:hypothetical protein
MFLQNIKLLTTIQCINPKENYHLINNQHENLVTSKTQYI